MKTFKFLSTTFKNLVKDNVFSNAATIAYFSLLSSVPLLFLITTFLGFLTGSNQVVIKKLYVLISPFVPNLSFEFWQKLTGWFAKSSYSLNFFSFVILLFSSTFVFSSIDKSLREIFKDFGLRKRSSFESFLIYFLLIIFLIFIVFIFMLADTSLIFLRKIVKNQELFFLRGIVRHATLLLPLCSFLLQIFTVAAILSISIGRKLLFKKLFFSSSFIIVMWTIAIKAFSWYVSFIPTYNIIYGSMSIFIVFTTWNYYSALIFLIGAEILKVISENE